jgi:Uncharacterised nucleotidyltransferase
VKPNRQAESFYGTALRHLLRSGVPFLIGGAYAMREYGGIFRDTKDLDVFCLPGDYPRILQVFAGAGFRTEVTHPHWVAKAFQGEYFVDIIFGSSNDLCPVDDLWFQFARKVHLLGFAVPLIPPEEMIWSKAYVQDRYRFDGADIAHILRKMGAELDWHRLLVRMDRDWEVLLAHLINFRFAYPSERDIVPEWILRELSSRVQQQLGEPALPERICRGPRLTPHDYQIDIAEWGYRDPRTRPTGGNHFQRNNEGADRRVG